MSTTPTSCSDFLERLAGDFLSLELTDLPGLVHASEQFEKLGDKLRSEYPTSADACAQCKQRLDKIVLEDESTPQDSLKAVEETITCLQSVVDGDSEESICFPVLAASPPSSPTSEESTDPQDDESTSAPSPDPELQQLFEPVAINDSELTSEFIGEAAEHFDIADENLVILENTPGDSEAIGAVFRAFHTVKGTSGFLGLVPISKAAHLAENLLDAVRHETVPFESSVADATFAALDALKSMVTSLAEACRSGSDLQVSTEITPAIQQLKQVLDSTKTNTVDKTNTKAPESASTMEILQTEPDRTREEPNSPRNAEGADSSKKAAQKQALRETMKIDVGKIDMLLDTIGELVIIESIVTEDEHLHEVSSPGLKRNLSQLTKITRSLQDMGMSMRMVPIGATFRKMSRLVRDLARKAGKELKLEISGEDTEIDKGMVEQLQDPLVHMVRNAVDHGIEPSPEEREQADKPRTGTVSLKAFHEGGGIHIQIQDDGRGLNRKAIAERALERGIATEVESMTDEEVYGLIFAPGFSTANQITDVSGRGVGMDVVKRNIEGMRGNVRIESEPGKGSSFTLVLPLTMAIINGMHCQVGGEKYIIPLLSIIQSFQPTRDVLYSVSGKGEMVQFRSGLLPLYRLNRLFDVAAGQEDPTDGILIVVEDAGHRAALLVDKLVGQRQTVIKSLGEGLGEVPGLAGATILSDGTPGLIIDVHGIIAMATGKTTPMTQ